MSFRVFRDRYPSSRLQTSIYDANAIEQIDAWLESPVSQCLSETDGYWQNLRSFLIDGRIEGPMVYDARIAAICRVHGVVELWSADRDFSRFPGLKVHNPLL
ncbi:MAG: hypothetical protein OXG15_10050 [Gammaproteobacteria bacterium]|nr:hypothetical protein [Gammaproteobacteria bacterium]